MNIMHLVNALPGVAAQGLIWGIMAIGAILYYLVYQVGIWLGLNTDDMKLITALIVAAFLAIPYWKGKYAHVKVPAGSANAGAKTGGDQDA